VPIRTPRGRSAAYRAIWQWPLRSPARLAAVVLAVLVVVAGVSYGFAALAGDGAGRAAAPNTTPSTVTSRPPSGAGAAPSGTATPSALPPVAELTPGTLPPGSAPAAALQVATQWANAWVNHPAGTTSAQWVERLRPYTTDEYLVVLGGVDPANVPANRVTGPARAVRYSPKSVQVEVPTDALTLQVLVVEGDTGWKVAGHDRVGQ
jgi:hypothetical protein